MTTRNILRLLIAAGLALLPCALRANDIGACGAAPLPQGFYRVSSPYGPRVYPLSHTSEWRMHWGVDFVCPRGTLVRAMGDGVVLFAGRWGCYGNVVILRHPGEFITLYAHLSRINAALCRGMSVRAGEVIALSGSTGCVTGPHLHLECWVGKTRQRVNPALICAALRITRKGVRL